MDNLRADPLSPNRLEYFNAIIQKLNQVGTFSRWTSIIGMLLFFLMVLVNFVDVVMRYVFNQPLLYILDITGLMMLTGIFLSLAHTYNEGAHVGVDLILVKLKPKSRLMVEIVASFLGLLIIAVSIWANFSQLFYTLSNSIVVSQSVNVSKTGFVAIIIIGLICVWLLILRDLLKKIIESIKLNFKTIHWILTVTTTITVVVLAIVWMQPRLVQLTLPMVGVIGLLVWLVLLFSGMPVAFGLIITSVVFISHIRGFEVAINMLGAEFYSNTSSYAWSVIPFFVLMGYLAFYSRFGEDLYYAAYRWIGHFRGGLALTTIAACTGLAAIVGDAVSCVATMSSIARPEMKKYGYDDRLTTGCITGGASLGPIIPPSVPFIIYGVLTSMSIGVLFVAGIIPGIIIAIFFCMIILFWVRINPNVGPPGVKSNWKQRIVSLKAGGPVLILFLFVIGGMFMGIFTPTEGGAMGAVGVVIMALILRRFNRNSFAKALIESGKVTAIVFLILIGSALFSKFGVWCNLSGTISSFLASLGFTPLLVVGLILIIFFALGFVVDTLALTLIGVPIVHPIVVALGFDPIWFAVLLVATINLVHNQVTNSGITR